MRPRPRPPAPQLALPCTPQQLLAIIIDVVVGRHQHEHTAGAGEQVGAAASCERRVSILELVEPVLAARTFVAALLQLV